MQKYLKILNKLTPSLRIRLISTIEKISKGDLKNLDLLKLSGNKNIYRCRVGKIRIIFQKNSPENIILDLGYRGDIYQKY